MKSRINVEDSKFIFPTFLLMRRLLLPFFHLLSSSHPQPSLSFFFFFFFFFFMEPSTNSKFKKKMSKKKKNGSYPPFSCGNHAKASSLCFFCAIEEADPSTRRAQLAKCFHEMPSMEEQELVLVMSGLWHIAMAQPNDPEFPALGIFSSMANLINRGVEDKAWLQKHHNIFIPYYAAHIIGSYTIKSLVFAENAVSSGVVEPLMELLRGKISWVEQRVAVRALGHLVSYEETFEAVAGEHEEELVDLCTKLASACLDVVYREFIGVGERNKRPKYHCDLLTRGLGGWEMENRKAEEWASQLQCWSLYILNCFACKERGLHLICRQWFLRALCGMWGGLANDSSPAGIGLLRILCYCKKGRKSISECKEVVESLCNLSRSSDDWQYMGIDCLLLLLKDPDTRSKVLEASAVFLVDLIELKDLGSRKNLGDVIATTLLLGYMTHEETSSNTCHKHNVLINKDGKATERALKFAWNIKVERRRREEMISKQEEDNLRLMSSMKRKQGNERFWRGDVQGAVVKYSEALEVCPLKMRKERAVLYSNRAQCHLILRAAEGAIRDATRALCLSDPPNSHRKSLWRRAQAYDMKEMGKESLMDCVMFVNGCMVSKEKRRVKVPYYAARMVNKQMNATWLFSEAKLRQSREGIHDQGHRKDGDEEEEEAGLACNIDHEGDDQENKEETMVMTKKELKGCINPMPGKFFSIFPKSFNI